MTVDIRNGVVRSDECTLLPSGQERDLVARQMEASLRLGQYLAVRAEVRVALVDPAATREFHIVPADRNPFLDILGVSGMQPLALLARDRETLGSRPLVELDRRLAADVGAGERALLAEITGRWIPDLVDRIGGPRDAAVDIRLALPEALGLPPNLAGRVTAHLHCRRHIRRRQVGGELREHRRRAGAA